MEYLGTKRQTAFIDSIFDSLIKNSLVKENVHYEVHKELHKDKSEPSHVWEKKLYHVILNHALEILEAIGE